ncbi:sugar kinase [Jannaschia aquimarina]|uniref:KdgK_2 protein n=1 Tax=Jannaschia aquimarina TaxID=935700 RepID=A0A0D1EGM0_9RHOB|nr:sugar kinase [Jannaschia aquimarina]KIT14995.1 2-dehydro-3-deoxygluconokinase [Jannaschia aquimarina]SNS61499.1 2-keto-3-deoxygluconate kinase [Jannaschia aquimarina]
MIDGVLSIGECMVEFGPAECPGLFRRAFAGDTFNTAWYMRRRLSRDIPVHYHTAVGTDAISDAMVRFIEDAGIETGSIARDTGRTIGLYTIHLSDGERSFTYWRDGSAARLLAGHPLNPPGQRPLVYLSGITLAILSSPDRTSLMEGLAELRAQGAVIAFDPNIRPRLWEDADIACKTITAMADESDIVLPSFDDEAAAFGDADPSATLERYAAAPCVIVKNGPEAITIRSDGEISTRPAHVTQKIVDTTAAGDSFNAGFLAAYIKGEPVTSCVEEGAALAARVVGQHGGLCDVA